MNKFRKLVPRTVAVSPSFQKTQSRRLMLAWIGKMFEPNVSKTAGSIFDYNVEDISGAPLEMSTLKGKKAYLVVNVASQ